MSETLTIERTDSDTIEVRTNDWLETVNEVKICGLELDPMEDNIVNLEVTEYTFEGVEYETLLVEPAEWFTPTREFRERFNSEVDRHE